MKLFYAMGGGLGHLYRVRTFIDQVHLTSIKVLTNNPLAEKLFSSDEIVSVQHETPQGLIQLIQSSLENLSFTELYVDAFPAGLFGELNAINVRTVYLARRLNWNNYKSLINPGQLRFEETLIFEELEEAHMQFVNKVSANISHIDLNYPEADTSKILSQEVVAMDKPIWLIVHSFIREEVEALVAYAKEIARLENQDPVFMVLSDQQIVEENVIWYAWFPAQDWFPLAERIFIGGGFNVLKQAVPYSEKITAIPFPRRYDDQAWRVKNFKSAALLA